ncbi:MAG: TRAP transporter small permease [Burkholderiaceae bacterium]|nr:TRAP transporter small permease [Burkholderiaceae bacterium]
MKHTHAEPSSSSAGSGMMQSAGSHRGPWQRFESGFLVSAATVMFLLSTGVMLYEAFGRAFLDTSYFWAEESVRYLMLWAFFLTLGAAGSAGHHIRTDLLIDYFGPGFKKFSYVLASFVGLLFSAMLFYASIPQLIRYYTIGMMTESNLDLPLWVLFLAMPIGAFLFLMYYLSCLIRAVKGENPFAGNGVSGSEL